MSSHGRRLDHWTTSLDAVEALRLRITEVDGPQEDPITRRLMAQVAHAKSSSFIALLDREGHVLDVNPAALIAGGIDRTEVIGLPLWVTPWWANATTPAKRDLERCILGAAEGRFARFDVDVQIEGAGRAAGAAAGPACRSRGRDGQVAFIVAEGRPITPVRPRVAL